MVTVWPTINLCAAEVVKVATFDAVVAVVIVAAACASAI